MGPAIDAVFVVIVEGVIASFGEAVCIEEECFACIEADAGGGELDLLKHAERKAGGVEALYCFAACHHDGQVSGIVNFDFAGGLGLAKDEGCVEAGEDALTEDAIDLFNDLAEGKADADETAEEGVELGHEHGGGDAFAGDITEDEEELAVGEDEIAVVSADGAGGCVMIASFPTAGAEIRRGQETALEIGGEVEIALEGGAACGREVIEAITDEWIGEQAIGFDRVVALITDA